MKKVGFIGWRGMVGSVLMERMHEENDFGKMESYFFSTSKGGEPAPAVMNGSPLVLSSIALKELMKMDILISCQGGEFTLEMVCSIWVFSACKVEISFSLLTISRW